MNSDPDTTLVSVRFNPLVHSSVLAGAYRLPKYDECMRYKNFIARAIHKRMSHLFPTVEDERAPYTIWLSAMIRDYGLPPCAELSDNLRQVEEALDEMREAGTIKRYEVRRQVDERREDNLTDAEIAIFSNLREAPTEQLTA